MVKIGKKEKSGELYKAILQLRDEQECYDFFQDLCTVSELRSMEQRFEVAMLLHGCFRNARIPRCVSPGKRQPAGGDPAMC